MALFKISKGTSQNLPSILTEGYCWYTYDDSKFYIDFKNEDGILVRQAINAQEAETLCGLTLEELKAEIATQDAVILHEAQSYTDAAVNAIKDNYVENNGNAHFSYLEVSGDFIVQDGSNFELGEGVALTLDGVNIGDNLVNKIGSIDTWADDFCADIDTSGGISWTEQFSLYGGQNLDGNNLAQGTIMHRIPIIAGNNVTFEVDDQAGTVSINATGGSTPQEYQMPTFDLTAMGLSEVPLDGTQSSLALDTNDIVAKLGEGPVKFIFTAMGTSISVIPSSIGVAGAVWICTTNVDFNGMKMICTIGIEVGTADAGGSIGVWFSSSATPVRGTDYWTEEDKAEIKAYVDDAILNGAW